MAAKSRPTRGSVQSPAKTAGPRDPERSGVGPSYTEYRRRRRGLVANRTVTLGIVTIAFIWATWGTGFGVGTLIEGLVDAGRFVLLDLLPPRLDVIVEHLDAAYETLLMSYVGVVMSIVLSIPLGILAARNVTVHRAVAYLAKMTTAFIRAVPSIVFGIFLVAVFGLGPLPGTLALGIGGVGILAKNYADSLETIDMGQLEGLRASGGTWLQSLGQGVWPQFKPGFISWSLFRFDLNIRAAAVLGLVGAGGIGYDLIQAINLYQFRTASTIVGMIFVMILAVETVTATLRRKLL